MYAEEQQAQSPKTSQGAIWSFVLSLVGLVMCCSFASIPAVICGHVALPKIKRSGGLLTGSGFATAGLIIGYVGIALQVLCVILLPSILAPAIAAARASAYRAVCVSNMHQVGTALIEYANENQGNFPNDLQALVPNFTDQFGLTPDKFVVLGTNKQPGNMANVSQWTDFVLVPNRKATGSSDSILLFTKPECYPNGGGNILYVDGRVSVIMLPDEYNRLTRGLDTSK
jgi:prepilin-type processing-associated H-X9-DG protein